MTENTQANQNELNIQDLALARAVIELSTERGTFKANEIAELMEYTDMHIGQSLGILKQSSLVKG